MQNKRDRSQIIRTLVACLLWGLLIMCFLTLIRANIISQRALQTLKDGTVSPEELSEYHEISEVARSFASEWASFDNVGLTSSSDFINRMKTFGKRNEVLPGKGIQRCNSANVIKITPLNDNHFRAQVALRVSRVTTGPVSDRTTIAGAFLIKLPESSDYSKVEEPTITYWKDYFQTVEISLIRKDGTIHIAGYPVIIKDQEVKDLPLESLIKGREAPEDFKVFCRQMLDMYYRGEDLNNYTKKTEICSLGDYELKKFKISGFSKENDVTQAVAEVEIDSKTLSGIKQLIVIEAVQDGNRWFLTRLGAY